MSSFSAVPLQTQTCEPPPNTDSYLLFQGLTSGYWFGCDGDNDALLPPGKCYHGWLLTPGTNNDDTGRPKFQQAHDLARDTTIAIVNQLLDSPGVAGNFERTAALMGYRTHAFAIDTTASMDTEMLSVKAQVRATVEAAMTATDDTHAYVLVPFIDNAGAPNATYYLHQESSSVTIGYLQLKSLPPDSAVAIRSSGNLKGQPPGTASIRRWETQEGVPGFEGVIPSGSVVSVKLWMKKTTARGTVFPWASIQQNWFDAVAVCDAVGNTPLTTTLTAYTFQCVTTQPIAMFPTHRFVVLGGYSMTVSPGNHNMEVQVHFEGTADSNVILPNPQ